MKIITENAEDQFLECLPRMKKDADGWAAAHLALSRRLPPDEMFGDLSAIPDRLAAARKEARALCAEIGAIPAPDENAQAYLFRDNDIVILARPPDEAGYRTMERLHETLGARAGDDGLSTLCVADTARFCKTLGHERAIGARRMQAYEAIADGTRRRVIGARRTRRENRLALIVEDDVAIATWVGHILNGECDLVSVRTGEEAVTSYLEHAPDIVLLNIHLAGMDGYQTLRALRQADEEAFIVMFSGDAVRGNVLRALGEGAAGFVKKPAPPSLLVKTVRKSPFMHTRKNGAPGHTRV